MGNKEELQLTLEGLNCANCARKIEEKVGRMEGVKESNLNFTTTTLNVKLEKKVKEEHVISEIKKIVEALEQHAEGAQLSQHRLHAAHHRGIDHQLHGVHGIR